MGEADFVTILLFFAYTWGLGYALLKLAPPIENFFERNIMRIGFGLAALPFLAILLSIVTIPLHWWLILLLSMAVPVYELAAHLIKGKKFSMPDIRMSKSTVYFIIVLALFAFTLFMYAKGAFAYPYLEDDDSWSHAVGIQYVSSEKTVFHAGDWKNYNKDIGYTDPTGYLDPYPPAYDTILGILKQTSPEMMWAMKFFNALIISLSILFFYYFSRKLSGSPEVGLASAFILAMLPSYLSHFIWSHSLIPGFFMIAFYALEGLRQPNNPGKGKIRIFSRAWIWPAGIAMSAVFFTSYDQAIKFALFLLAYFAAVILFRRQEALPIIYSGIVCAAACLAWVLPLSIRFGSFNAFISQAIPSVASISGRGVAGSADRIYSLKELVVAQGTNMINSPVGIGIGITILALAGILSVLFFFSSGKSHKKAEEADKAGQRQKFFSAVLLWFAIALLGLYGLPVRIIPFRYWHLLALPLAMLAGFGLYTIFQLSQKISNQKQIPYAVVIGAILLLWFTSGAQKYQVNTAIWPPGAFWASNEEIQAHLWLSTLPEGVKIYPMANRAPVVAFDRAGCAWCPDENLFRAEINNRTAAEIYSFAKAKGYDYLFMEALYVKKFGPEAANSMLASLGEIKELTPVMQSQGGVVFKIN